MLKILRKEGVTKKILWFIAGVVILSFGFFGQASIMRNSKEPKIAGKIFGQNVALKDYDEAFQQTRVQAMMQYGREFEKIASYLNLYSQTWDRLILLHEANRRRIKISDEAVVQAIDRYPFFQNKGLFDKKIYNYRTMYDFKIQPRAFEEGIRNVLKITQLFDQVTKDITVPDEDVWRTYQERNEQVQVSYVLFPAEDYLDQVTFDEIQAKEFYLTHKDQFLLPPMINVAYIRIDAPAGEPAGEEQPAASTDASASTADAPAPEPETRPDNKERDKARAIAEAVSARLTEDPDFQAAAEQYQLPSGESGFFSLEKPDLSLHWSFPMIQAMFQLPKGQIIGPFETDQGYQIIKVIGQQEPTIPDYPAAQEQVREKWTRFQAMQIAKERATAALDQVRQHAAAGQDFAQALSELGLTAAQTPFFSRGEYLPTIGLSEAFMTAAFTLPQGTDPISDLVEVEKGFCFLHLDGRHAADKDAFQQEQAALTEELLDERKSAFFSDYLSRLRIQANLQDNIPEIMGLKTAPATAPSAQ